MPTSKKQLKYFSNTNNSTTLTPPGPPGVSREAKLSIEFEFDSLVCYNWAQNQATLKSCQETIIFDIFFVNSEVFWTFLVLGPILAHQTTKFELSGWFCFSRHPWDPWGRLNSRVTRELAKSVTVSYVGIWATALIWQLYRFQMVIHLKFWILEHEI